MMGHKAFRHHGAIPVQQPIAGFLFGGMVSLGLWGAILTLVLG